MDSLRLQVILDGIDKATGPLRAALKGADALSKSAKETRDRLRELNSQQKQLDGFRAVTARVSETAQAMDAAKARVRELANALAATATPTANAKKEYSAATAELRKLTREHERAKQAQTLANADMQRAGVPVAQLAARQRQLAGEIASTNRQLDHQAQQLNRAKAAQRAYQQSMQTRDRLASAGMSAAAIGAAGGAAVGATLKAYADAENAGTRLAAAMMRVGGVVPAQYAQINELATRLGDKLPGTTAQFQDMMQMLVRQGMSAKAILGGLGEATAYLAVQLDMPTVAAAEFASKLQDATRTTEADMMRLMDVIQRTYYLGVDSGNMLQGFSKLSPALSILRMKGLEAAKALAPLLVMADQSDLVGEAAGNAFRKVFQYAIDAKKIGKGNEELAGTGIRLDFTDGKGEFAGLDKMFAQLDKLNRLNSQKREAVIKAIFGDDAETKQALSIMIEKGAAGYAEVQQKMAAQANLQERVNVQLGTLRALWEATTGTFTNLLAALGEAIAPQAKALTEWIGEAAASMRQWATENPRLASTLMQIVAMVAIGATALGALALGAAAILGPLALLKLGIGLVLPAIAAIAAPAAGAVLAIAAIAAAGIALWQNWDKIRNGLAEIWTDIKTNIIGAGVQWILDKLAGLKSALGFSATLSAAPAVATPAPLRTGGATSIVTHAPIQIVQQPGQSSADLAKTVRAELDARDRQRAVERRSRLTDEG